MHYIELPKVTKDGEYGKSYMWLRYLMYEGTKDRELTDFIDSDTDIKQAHKEYEKFLSDEHLQHLYLAREMYQHDEATRIATAKKTGMAEGITLEKKTIISAMHKKGLSTKQISELTDIPEDEINSLLK